jgi:seryl-tRNA synthetase
MLSVVLGASLYLYVKKADEATAALAAANLGKQQVEGEKKATEEENKVLKTLIGFPERSTSEIRKQFAEDMETYGNARQSDAASDPAGAAKPLLDPNTLSYSRLLGSMWMVIQDRTDELMHSRAAMADLQANFKSREAAKDAKINALLKSYETLKELIQKIEADSKQGHQATAKEIDEMIKQWEEINKNALEAMKKGAEVEKALKKELEDKQKEIERLLQQLKKFQRPGMMVPPGEIIAVNLPTRLVWINRGRADDLQRGMKFAVCSVDSTAPGKPVKKGTVEVTLVEGEHSAQARILDDIIANPIIIGDKIFNSAK